MVRGAYYIIKEQKKVKDKFNLISLDDARCYIKKQINRELKHIDVKFLKKVDNRIEEIPEVARIFDTLSHGQTSKK